MLCLFNAAWAEVGHYAKLKLVDNRDKYHTVLSIEARKEDLHLSIIFPKDWLFFPSYINIFENIWCVEENKLYD